MGKKFLIVAPVLALCFASAAYADSRTTIPLVANVQSVNALSISISSAEESAQIDVTPSFVGGVFDDSDEVSVTVATNNYTGYQLNMSSSSASLNSDTNNGYFVASLDTTNVEGYTPSSFPTNTWGYSIKNNGTYGNYFGIGDRIITIGEGNTPTSNASVAMKFGAKVGSNIPAGTYSTTIIYTAVAKPSYYMQDVSLWGDMVDIGKSIRAIDSRDMKTYWVTRIETDPEIPDSRADCTGTGANRVCSQLWMTQNLDLELTAGEVTYTHYDTDLGWTTNDLGAVWTPQTATYTTFTPFMLDKSLMINSPESYIEESYSLLDDWHTNVSYHNTTYEVWDCEKELHLSAEECAHYKEGNSYSFYTAVAHSATNNNELYEFKQDESYYSMPNSICPAGWRLPVGPESSDGANSDFDYIFYHNNITSKHAANDISAFGHWGEEIGYKISFTSFENIEKEPLWFVRSGWTDCADFHEEEGLYQAYDSEVGVYWTSTFFYDPVVREEWQKYKAFQFYYAITDFLSPTSAVYLFPGQSVRCIAR